MNAGSDDPPLDERQQLLTAWVDGELSVQERLHFERMIADDPQLAIAAAQHKELLDLSRGAAQMEPTDREARRFWNRFYNRGEWRLGWCLLLGGTIVLAGFLLYELLFFTDLHVVAKGSVCAILLGGGILMWNTVRLKLRTSRFDRYRGVLY